MITDAAGYRLASWSPDGAHIALTAGGLLRVAPADTLVTTQVADLDSTFFRPGDGELAWSPDSASIAYHSDQDGVMELFVAAADGSNPTKVSMPLGADAAVGTFFWSDDSTRLYYEAGGETFEAARPSEAAPEPVDASNYDEVREQVRMWVEAAGVNCTNIRLTRLSLAASPDVADCQFVTATCGTEPDVRAGEWWVCRVIATNRWRGVTAFTDSISEYLTILSVAGM